MYQLSARNLVQYPITPPYRVVIEKASLRSWVRAEKPIFSLIILVASFLVRLLQHFNPPE